MNGYIHSIESFGTVDGPGVRLVVFMQGCPMRCRYCHNPDTWDIGKGREISAKEVISIFEKNKPFYKNGGITVTGGEPLLQLDFLIELFKTAKERDIHTCIDTSGVTYRTGESEYNTKLLTLLGLTELVMLDLKHIDNEAHKALTGKENTGIKEFAALLSKLNVTTWIRHVLVPGVNDDEKSLVALGEFMATLESVKVLDVLPYHDLGKTKYESLGIPYTLANIPNATREETERAKKIIMNAYFKAKKQ